MAFNVIPGFTGLGRRRGTLLGEGSHPIKTYSLLLFTVVVFESQPTIQAFAEFLKANASPDEYLAEHRPQVRARLRRAVEKAKRQASQDVRGRVDANAADTLQVRERCGRLQSRVDDLQRALRCQILAAADALQEAEDSRLSVDRYLFLRSLIGPGNKGNPEWTDFLAFVRAQPDTPEGFEAAIDAAMAARKSLIAQTERGQ